MSMQTEFIAVAGPVFSGRVYPQGSAPPFVGTYATFSRVAAIEQSTLDTNGGVGNLVNTRMQVDVYASNYDAASVAASALRATLKTWSIENILLSERDMFESDTKLHRVMLDLSIWHY